MGGKSRLPVRLQKRVKIKNQEQRSDSKQSGSRSKCETNKRPPEMNLSPRADTPCGRGLEVA
jgi:hypothetical protein